MQNVVHDPAEIGLYITLVCYTPFLVCICVFSCIQQKIKCNLTYVRVRAHVNTAVTYWILRDDNTRITTVIVRIASSILSERVKHVVHLSVHNICEYVIYNPQHIKL